MDKGAQRLGMYKKIEIGRKQLPEMSDDSFFRDWLEKEFSKRSRKDLSHTELVKLVNKLGQLGAVYKSAGTNKQTKPHVRPDFYEIPDNVPHANVKRQICAIWRKLGYSMTSLETRIKREFKVATFAWVHDGKQLSSLLCNLQKREKAYLKKQAASESEA